MYNSDFALKVTEMKKCNVITTNMPPPPDPLQLWNKRFKRYVTVYPKLEKDHEPDKFDRIFRSVAKFQGVDKFFAPS